MGMNVEEERSTQGELGVVYESGSINCLRLYTVADENAQLSVYAFSSV